MLFWGNPILKFVNQNLEPKLMKKKNRKYDKKKPLNDTKCHHLKTICLGIISLALLYLSTAVYCIKFYESNEGDVLEISTSNFVSNKHRQQVKIAPVKIIEEEDIIAEEQYMKDAQNQRYSGIADLPWQQPIILSLKERMINSETLDVHSINSKIENWLAELLQSWLENGELEFDHVVDDKNRNELDTDKRFILASQASLEQNRQKSIDLKNKQILTEKLLNEALEAKLPDVEDIIGQIRLHIPAEFAEVNDLHHQNN